MKRKNYILSALLSISILATAACSNNDLDLIGFAVTSGETSISETMISEAITSVSSEASDSVVTTETSVSSSVSETSFVSEVLSEAEAGTAETVSVETESETEQTLTEEVSVDTEESSVISATTTTTKIETEEIIVTEIEEIEKKYIALTFDDGPNTTTTNEVLDVLEQYGIKGSFFLIGNNINAENESVVKRAYDMGCDIGNHSKAHLYMNELTVDEIKSEIDYVSEYIVKITGEGPKFFRPPYIAVNNTMYDSIDLTFIAGFGCNDWDDKVPAERRAKVILRQAQDGGIILLHDAQGNSKTVEALHTIIPELQAQGYEFVTLTELFELKGIKLDPDDKNLYTFVGQ